jgi:hypothetical protein
VAEADRVALKPQSAIRNPQSAIPNSPSPSNFARQMVRSQSALAQNPAGNFKDLSAPAPEVLSSFQIERNGQQVRIVDADGSDYVGQVVDAAQLAAAQSVGERSRQAFNIVTTPPGAANAAKLSPPADTTVAGANSPIGNIQANAPASQSSAPSYAGAAQNQVAASNAVLLSQNSSSQSGEANGFAFQVSGMNRKLNQNVTVYGNLVNLTQPADAPVFASVPSNQLQQQSAANAITQNNVIVQAPPPANQTQNSFQNGNFNNSNILNTQNAAFPGQFWRVTGQVQVGPSNRFDLDAATPAP